MHYSPDHHRVCFKGYRATGG